MPPSLAHGLAVLALLLAASAAPAQTPLFTPLGSARLALSPRQSEVLDRLEAEAAFVEASVVAADVSVLGAAPTVSLALPDRDLTLSAKAVDRRGPSDLSWLGVDADAPFTRARFVVREDRITGVVWTADRVYAVRPLTGGLHAVAVLDPRAYRDHGDDYAAFERSEQARLDAEARLEAQTPLNGSAAAPVARTGALTTVDVVVAYTAEVAAAVADPEAFAQLAVDAANDTYVKTGMGVRLALLAAYETPTAATADMVADLTALQATGDGRFDEAHAYRDGYGADLIALIGPGAGTYGSCGLGYVNAGPTHGFTLSAYDCAVGGLTLAHEVGHNLGAQHDPYVNGGVTLAYPHGQGYVNTTGRWRTVMAYNDECIAGGYSCVRIPYWSTPDVDYDDVDLPEADGPTGDAVARDNARVLVDRAPTTAAFRARGTPPVLAYSSPTIAATLPEGGTTSTTVTISNAAAGGARDLAWSVSLANATASTDAGARLAGNCTSGQTAGQSTYNGSAPAASGGNEFGQSFVAPCGGRLRVVSPTISYGTGFSTSWTATLRIYEGEGTGGAELTSQVVSHTNGSSGVVSLPIALSNPIEVSAGQTYTWFLDLTSGGTAMLFSASNPDPNGVTYVSPTGNPTAVYLQSSWDLTYGLTFDPPAPSWIEVSPAAGTVFAGADGTFTVSFDAAGLDAGTYTADLVLSTNDPLAIEQTIPVALTVAPGGLAVADGFGWRLLASPYDGTTVGTLAAQNLVQGLADSYPGAGANLYTGFNGTAWTPAGATTEALPPGYGFAWYLFDEAIDPDTEDPSNSASVALPMTLSAAGAEPAGDVSVSLHADGDGWNLLGNPYAVDINLSGVDGWAGFELLRSYVGQVWQCTPNAASPVECIGSYTTTTLLGDVLPRWSGVFVQAATAGTLTFPHTARTVAPRQAPRLIGLELAAAGGAAVDRAAAVVFRDGAHDGWDGWDADKLASMASPSVQVALGGERDGEPVLKAQDSRALEPASFEVPVHVASHGAEPDLVLTWPRLDGVPSDWALTLTDHEADVTIDLRAVDRYAFVVAEAAARTSARPGATARHASGLPRFTLAVRTSNAVDAGTDPDLGTWLGVPAPNPARNRAAVAYRLAEAGPARLTVVDLLGREVAVLADGPHAAGDGHAELLADRLAPGLYVVRLEAGGRVLTQRAVVVR